MTALLNILVATAIVAGLMAMRAFVMRAGDEQRSKSNRRDAACSATACFHECTPPANRAADEQVSESDGTNRSTPDAT